MADSKENYYIDEILGDKGLSNKPNFQDGSQLSWFDLNKLIFRVLYTFFFLNYIPVF